MLCVHHALRCALCSFTTNFRMKFHRHAVKMSASVYMQLHVTSHRKSGKTLSRFTYGCFFAHYCYTQLWYNVLHEENMLQNEVRFVLAFPLTTSICCSRCYAQVLCIIEFKNLYNLLELGIQFLKSHLFCFYFLYWNKEQTVFIFAFSISLYKTILKRWVTDFGMCPTEYGINWFDLKESTVQYGGHSAWAIHILCTL